MRFVEVKGEVDNLPVVLVNTLLVDVMLEWVARQSGEDGDDPRARGVMEGRAGRKGAGSLDVVG